VNDDAPRPMAPRVSPPKVDRDIRSVELNEILFDTFRGGFIPLAEASDETVEGLRDAIRPIYEPKYDDVSGGNWLRSDDLVIGYATDGEAFAYPIKMLNLHEIINDFIGGKAVLITYCPLCASAVVYNRELDGDVLVFGNTSALHESDMIMYDHNTGSYWFQVLGEAVVGELTGKRMDLLPSQTVTWTEWKKLHPDTKILALDQGIRPIRNTNPYDRDSFVGYEDRVSSGRFAFPVTESKLDDRLRFGDMVLTVQVGETHKAYALTGMPNRVINDEIEGRAIVMIARSDGPSGSAFFSLAGDQLLAFRITDDVVEDLETKSRWDVSGFAVSGPLAGTQLELVPSRTSMWFSVIGALPDLILYDEADTP
jgi:hypothetical protein